MNTLRNLTLSLLAIIALSFIACEKDPVVEPEPAPAPAPEPTPTATATPITNDFLLGDWELYKVDYFAILTPDIPESGLAQQMSIDTLARKVNISLNADTLIFYVIDGDDIVGDIDVFAHTIGLVEGKINADTLKVNTISGRFHGDNKFDKFDGWTWFKDKNDSTYRIPYSDTLIKIRYYANNDELILEQTFAGGDITSQLQAKANGYNPAPSTKYIFSEKALAYFRRKAK